MVCPNCKNENNGIKLNGKLFCISCGEVMEDAIEILEHSYEVHNTESKNIPYEPRRFSKEGRDVTPKKQTNDTELFEAEEEILEEIEKVSMQQEQIKRNQKVKKNDRERITIEPSSDFELVPGEPDPIREPELPSPHDIQVEAHKNIDYEKELSFPLHEISKQEEIHKDVREKQEILTSFLKEGAKKTSIPKKKKVLSKKTKIIAISTPIVLILITAILVVVTYTTNYSNDPKVITKNIEEKPTFNYNSPSYIPPGYKLTNQSYSYSSEIHYFYEYLPNTEKNLIISISTSNITESNVLENVVKPQNEKYYKYPLTDFDVWFIGDNIALYIYNDLLYEISTSDTIVVEEVIKIVKGLI